MPTKSQKLPPLPASDVPIGWVNVNQNDANGQPEVIMNTDWFIWFKAVETTLNIVRTEVP